MQATLLFAFAAMFCWGIGDFLIQQSTRKIGDIESLLWIGVFGAVGLLPFVWNNLWGVDFYGILLLLVLSIVLFFSGLFNFEAYKRGKISVIDIVLTLELPFTIMLGYLFLQEQLTLLQFALVGLLMLGISMVSISEEKFHFKLERGILFALVAFVGVGIVNFLVALSSKKISPLIAIWFPWTLSIVLCLCVVAWRRGTKHLINGLTRYPWLIIAMAVFDTAAWCFYAFALKNGELGIITAITESYPVIAVVLGVTVGGEKIKMRQYGGAAVAILASGALALLI
jgi:drug/metabolite transporter (DMT)-like permease